MPRTPPGPRLSWMFSHRRLNGQRKPLNLLTEAAIEAAFTSVQEHGPICDLGHACWLAPLTGNMSARIVKTGYEEVLQFDPDRDCGCDYPRHRRLAGLYRVRFQQELLRHRRGTRQHGRQGLQEQSARGRLRSTRLDRAGWATRHLHSQRI